MSPFLTWGSFSFFLFNMCFLNFPKPEFSQLSYLTGKLLQFPFLKLGYSFSIWKYPKNMFQECLLDCISLCVFYGIIVWTLKTKLCGFGCAPKSHCFFSRLPLSPINLILSFCLSSSYNSSGDLPEFPLISHSFLLKSVCCSCQSLSHLKENHHQISV